MTGDLSLPGDRRMTVREVAEALGVDESTVRRHIKAIREDLGNVAQVQNGVATYMTEAEVTEIKRRVERSGRNDLGKGKPTFCGNLSNYLNHPRFIADVFLFFSGHIPTIGKSLGKSNKNELLCLTVAQKGDTIWI